MRSMRFVCLSITFAAFVGCGSGGTGGVPTASHGSSDTPPTGNSTPTGKGAGTLPGHITPGSGSGFGAGDPNTGCGAICGRLAACGVTSSTCLAGCQLAGEACLACVYMSSCETLDACASSCTVPSGTGSGGSQGAGGGSQGAGGSHTTNNDCSSVVSHLKNDCQLSDQDVSSFSSICSSLSSKCVKCLAGDCAGVSGCLTGSSCM